MKNHAYITTQFLNTPWAMQREWISTFARVLARHAQGVPPTPEALEQAQASAAAFEARRQQAQKNSQASPAIAVLPMYGAIVQRAGLMTDMCGGTSTEQFGAALKQAVADPAIGSILMDIDSPGGSVYGVYELADQIMAAKAKKPVAAIANSLAASAAYWLGCCADEFYCTPSGEVGSIGVWQAHEDWSAALEAEGVKTTLVSAGKFKTEGNPYGPLSEEAQAFMQSRVDDYYADFVKAVAKGRGVSVATVREGMGQGRVLGANDALKENMVDGVATFDEVVRKMQARMKSAQPTGAKATAMNTDEPDEAALQRRKAQRFIQIEKERLALALLA